MSLQTNLSSLASRLADEFNLVKASIAGKANTSHSHSEYATTGHTHTGFAATVHTHLLSQISNATAFGRSLAAVADAPSARALLEAAYDEHVHTGDYAPADHTHNNSQIFTTVLNYTPALYATTTNPIPGAGTIRRGHYVVIGKLCFVAIFYHIGTGWSLGSGSLQMSLPVPPKTDMEQVLNCHFIVGATEKAANAKIVGSVTDRIERFYTYNTSGNPVTINTSNTALAIPDKIIVTGMYEIN